MLTWVFGHYGNLRVYAGVWVKFIGVWVFFAVDRLFLEGVFRLFFCSPLFDFNTPFRLAVFALDAVFFDLLAAPFVNSLSGAFP